MELSKTVIDVGSLTGSATVCNVDDVLNQFLGCLLIPLCACCVPGTSNSCNIDIGVCTCATLLLILLAYNVRAAFFHCTGGPGGGSTAIFSTTATIIAALSILFIISVMYFVAPIYRALNCSGRRDCILVVSIAITLSTVGTVPFTCLECRGQTIHFTTLRLLGVILGVILGIVFFIILKGATIVFIFTVGLIYAVLVYLYFVPAFFAVH